MTERTRVHAHVGNDILFLRWELCCSKVEWGFKEGGITTAELVQEGHLELN